MHAEKNMGQTLSIRRGQVLTACCPNRSAA